MNALARSIAIVCCCWLALACLPSHARQAEPEVATQTPPAWDALTPEQRELLIAPLRERWNANPHARERMLRQARDWRALGPQDKQRAHRGARRLQHLSPQERQQMRALFQRIRDMPQQQRHETMLLFRHMRHLPPAEREALVQRWQGMTPAQRAQWLRERVPPAQR